MKTILFAYKKAEIEKLFAVFPFNEANILQVVYDKNSRDVLDWLGKRGVKAEILRCNDFMIGYEKEYADYIGELNKSYSQSKWWWALNLTNKNPITTYLCNRMYYCLLINKLIDKLPADLLVVIDNDPDVFKELSINLAERKDVRLINAIRQTDVLSLVKERIPLAVIWQSIATICNKCIAFIALGPAPKKNSVKAVVASILYSPSFKKGAYEDFYFGSFPKHLKDRGIPVVNFVWIIESYARMCKMIRRYGREYNIYPKECFIAFSMIALAALTSLRYFLVPYRVKSIPHLQGMDITYLVKHYIRREFTSSRFFANLVVYYAIKGLCKRQAIEKIYYPFENRSFEKMIIIAAKGTSPTMRTVGYQHASISMRHTNFLLAEEEAALTPLPDRIITMGEATKEMMETVGKFPGRLLSVGCAFRQSHYSGAAKTRREGPSNILVALATGIDEYVKVLQFLDRAFHGTDDFLIWIRPHPAYLLEEAIRIAGGVGFRFRKADRESLDECYRWADIVLYVHSTLSIEAINRGIPAINLRVEDILDPDPLFSFDAFKWRVDRPEELVPTIRRIASLKLEEFENRQREGMRFAQRYIGPRTAERIERFITA